MLIILCSCMEYLSNGGKVSCIKHTPPDGTHFDIRTFSIYSFSAIAFDAHKVIRLDEF